MEKLSHIITCFIKKNGALVGIDEDLCEYALYAYFNNYDYTPTSSDISNCGDYKGIVTAFATKGISGYTSQLY